MNQTCKSCSRLLKEGDIVKVVVTSAYHVLKSSVAYALDKSNMAADSSTLRHFDCQFPQGEDE